MEEIFIWQREVETGYKEEILYFDAGKRERDQTEFASDLPARKVYS
jgi:hypothetical protein